MFVVFVFDKGALIVHFVHENCEERLSVSLCFGESRGMYKKITGK